MKWTDRALRLASALPAARVSQRHVLDHPGVAHAASRAEVVSFDIFDTLLVRPLATPADMFYWLADDVDSASAVSLRGQRLAGEARARTEAASEGRSEVTIEQIAVAMSDSGALSLAQCRDLAALEQDLEHRFCRSHPPAERFFHHLSDEGVRIIVTSDTYLPSSTIESLLASSGFEGIEAVVVSSEFGVTKRDGGLFDHALDVASVAPEDMLHIGDTLTPDIIQARRRGITAIHVPRPMRQWEAWPFSANTPGLPLAEPAGGDPKFASLAAGLAANEFITQRWQPARPVRQVIERVSSELVSLMGTVPPDGSAILGFERSLTSMLEQAAEQPF